MIKLITLLCYLSGYQAGVANWEAAYPEDYPGDYASCQHAFVLGVWDAEDVNPERLPDGLPNLVESLMDSPMDVTWTNEVVNAPNLSEAVARYRRAWSYYSDVEW